jgi:hypothetical protein
MAGAAGVVVAGVVVAGVVVAGVVVAGVVVAGVAAGVVVAGGVAVGVQPAKRTAMAATEMIFDVIKTSFPVKHPTRTAIKSSTRSQANEVSPDFVSTAFSVRKKFNTAQGLIEWPRP